MADVHVPGLDDNDLLPALVRTAMAGTFSDETTPEGGALAIFSRRSRQPVNAADYGPVGLLSTLTAAIAAAEARGKHTPLRVPAGIWDVGNGLSLSGKSVVLVGDGAGGTYSGGVVTPTGTVFKASTQAGAVLDFTGWVSPPLALGAVHHRDFWVVGSGIADASLANAGIKFTSINSVRFSDISIMATGGPCVEMASSPGNGVYLSDFENIVMYAPIGVNTNDVPFFRANEPNGNRFRGWKLRSLGSTTGPVGPSGAVQIFGNATYTPHDNVFDAWWYEALIVPTGGTLFSLKGNANVIRDFQFFDSSKVSGATGTSHFRLSAPTITDLGGNIVTGAIPGKGTGSTDIDTGVHVQQTGNRIAGTKSYRGSNVTIDSGVGYTYVDLGGRVSGATDPGVIDNSGTNTNVVRDASMFQFPEGTGSRRFFSGRYYGPANHNLGSLNAVLSTEYAVPIFVPHAITVSELAIDLVTVLAGSSVRLGVYANDQTRDAPGALLLDAGTIDTSATTGIRSITGLSLKLGAGLYWLAFAAQGAGPIPVRGITGSLDPVAPTALVSAAAEINSYYQNSITGAFANWSGAALAATFNGPKIMLKVA